MNATRDDGLAPGPDDGLAPGPDDGQMAGADGLVLGVDGGNSKTQVLVARGDGTVIGSSRVAGCADIYQAASVDAALDVVERAVDEALGMAGATRAQVSAGAFSMAGADWPEDDALLEAELRNRGMARTIVVVNDAIGALWAGLPDGYGVVVACGTGTATGARGPLGEWHSSFWQGPQGASDIARQALEAAYRSELGIEEKSSLVARLPATLGMADIAAVLHAMTARDVDRPRIDRLAEVVLDEAERGDGPARRVVRAHGRELGDYAVAAARKTGIDLSEPFVLVLTGGVFRHPGRELGDALVARVRELAPNVQLAPNRHAPVVGALRLAFRARGGESRPVDATLEATVPAGL